MRSHEIVDGVVAGEPPRELRVGIGAANGVDLLDVLGIDGEFHPQPVGARRVERQAVSVVGLAAGDAGGVEPTVDVVEGLPVHLEGDVLEAADLGVDGLGSRVHLVVGELEEGQRAAVGQPEERVAVRDLALDLGVEDPLAPGRHQREPEDVFEEVPVGFVIANDERVSRCGSSGRWLMVGASPRDYAAPRRGCRPGSLDHADRAARQRRTAPGTSPSGMKTTMTTKIAPRTKFHRSIWALATFFTMTTSAAPAIGPSSVAVPPAITIRSPSAEAVRATACELTNWLQ